MKKIILMPCYLLACSISTNTLSAADDNAEIVELRQSCNANSVPIHNCFEDTDDLTSWIEETRNPIADSNAPLQVNIGPGTFTGFDLRQDTVGCNISLVGSGRQQTTLTRTGGVAFSFPDNCVLSVSDLTILGDLQKGLITIYLQPRVAGLSPGETTWTDVDVLGKGSAWLANSSCDSKHSWFNSRITSISSPTIPGSYDTCAEEWFYSTEITTIMNASGDKLGSVIEVHNGGEVHLYGSIVRLLSGLGVYTPTASKVFDVIDGDMHIHGTAIDVLSEEANDYIVFDVATNGHVHANETSYNLKTGDNATMTRIQNNGGMVRAPAVWGTSSSLPNVVSITGQDTAIYTGTLDGHPHNVVYDSKCVDKWFDMTSSGCL